MAFSFDFEGQGHILFPTIDSVGAHFTNKDGMFLR